MTFAEFKKQFDYDDAITQELHDQADTLGAPDPKAHPHVAQIAAALVLILKRLDRIAAALED